MPLNLTPDPTLISELAKRAQDDPQSQQAPTLSQPIPDQSSSPSSKWPMLAALLGGAADVASTQYGLSRGKVEQNPFLPQGRVGNGLALSGAYIGNALLSKYLSDHGHPTIGKILGYGGGIDGAASALHNVGLFKWPGEK